MTYTILRPSAFMESWLGAGLGFDLAGGRVQLFGDGDAPVSYISFRDVARFAVAALDNPAARDTELELGGPEAVRARDVVALAERVGGRKIEATSVPAEALEAQYAAAQDPMQKTFAALALGVARGNAVPMEETLRRIPVQMTTVREYVEQQMGSA
jgi:NADH dehydrogenase